MPVTWKDPKRFRPEVVLKRIAAVRTRNPDGKGSSFSGWEINQTLPLLGSMLEFPRVARDMDHGALIWRAVAFDPGDLTADSFMKELNRQLSAELSQREAVYRVLTSMSLDRTIPLGTVTVDGAAVRFCGATYPRKFSAPRAAQVKEVQVPASESPSSYTKIIATVKAKKPALAHAKAMRAVDLIRALWCFLCNSEMQIAGRNWVPINKVRLGPIHTVHLPDGAVAADELWFEPHDVGGDAFSTSNANIVQRVVRSYLRKLELCPYREKLVDALVLFVRALDEWNQTTAFYRLWAALESLASPDFAGHAAVVRRCAFLYQDADYPVVVLNRTGFPGGSYT